MKKSFMTRVLAVTLSAAMAFSLSSATNLVTASAATTSLTLSATDKTVDVDTRMVFKLAGSQASKWKVVNAATKDDAVAHLDRFTKKAVAVEAKSAGSTRLHVRVEKAKGKNAGKQKVLHADITVNATDATLASVTQKKADTLEAVLTAEVDSVAATNFSVVRVDGNVVIPVKAASLGTDKKTVTITTFSGMTDAKEYTVTYTNPKVTDAEKAKSEQKFTATSSTISDLALDATVITAASSTEVVKVQTIGDNGVILNEYKFSELAAKSITYSVTNISSGGYAIEDRIYLANVGDTATVNVVYHTYKYVNNVEEGKIEKSFTVTAVADATTMSSWGYTIATSTPAWDSSSYKQNTQFAVGDSRNAYFYFKDSKGVDKTASGYTVSSSDTSVMIINGTIVDNKTGIIISGVKAGSAYIVVSDSKGNLITTLPVTVRSARSATSVQLGASSVTVSNAIGAQTVSTGGIDKKSVSVSVKDQYGETYGTTNNATTGLLIENLVSPKSTTSKPKFDFSTNGKMSITAGNVPVGTYVFTINRGTSNTVYSTFTVNVVEPNTKLTPSYDVRLSLGNGEFIDSNSSIDLAVGSSNTAKTLSVQLGVLYGGVLYDIVDGSSVSIKNSAGAVQEMVTTSSSSLSIVSNGAIEKKYGVGSYTATVKASNPVLLNGNYSGGNVEKTAVFTITDSQIKATATVKNTAIANTLSSAFVSSAGNLVYSYDGRTLDIGASDIYFVSGGNDPSYRTSGTSNNVYYVYYVMVKVPVAWNSTGATPTAYTWQRVSVNATFTGVAGV